MQVPESVLAYLNDRAARRALNELRRFDRQQILDGLDWTELASFYRAQLAMRQFEAEWAIFGLELWVDVWGGLLAGWTALSPDEQHDGYGAAGLSTYDLLNTDDESLWFGRVFTSGSWVLYASVSAIPSKGLAVKVSCEGPSRSIRFTDLAERADDVGNWVSPALPVNADLHDASELRRFAALAADATRGRLRRAAARE